VHITCCYATGTGLWISLIRFLNSFILTAKGAKVCAKDAKYYFKPYPFACFA